MTKKKVIQIYLYTKDIDKLKEIADLENISFQDFIREILKDYIRNYKED